MSYNILESDYRVMDHNDLNATSDAAAINWEQVFNILYPSGSKFFNDWVQRQMVYECLGTRTNRDIAYSRLNQAENEVLRLSDERADQSETEIGREKSYNVQATYRAWCDMHQYYRDKYQVWATKYLEIFGTDWEKDLDAINQNKASKSKNSNVLSDDAKKEYLAKLKAAPVSKFE